MSVKGSSVTAVQADQVAVRLLAELPRALASGQLVAYFQPEIDLATGQVIAAEALIRWEHPEFGVLSPAVFMPLAERLSLTGALTRAAGRRAAGRQPRKPPALRQPSAGSGGGPPTWSGRAS